MRALLEGAMAHSYSMGMGEVVKILGQNEEKRKTNPSRQAELSTLAGLWLSYGGPDLPRVAPGAARHPTILGNIE